MKTKLLCLILFIHTNIHGMYNLTLIVLVLELSDFQYSMRIFEIFICIPIHIFGFYVSFWTTATSTAMGNYCISSFFPNIIYKIYQRFREHMSTLWVCIAHPIKSDCTSASS